MDAWGRLLLANEQGLVRVAADRPVDIVGLSRGQEVVRPEPVRLLPTSPQLVTTIQATLVRGREEVLLEVGDGEATVDPLGLVFGTWTLEVQATYEDGSIGTSSMPLYMAAASGATWTEHIQPIYADSCDNCHDGASETVLDSPESWEANIEEILVRVTTGQMPLAGEPLEAGEIALIQAWVAGDFAR